MSASIQNRQEFQATFQENYALLCNYARRFVRDTDTCEDLVQTVFVRLWENRDAIQISGSVTNYLYSATRNAALDYLRSEKRKGQMLADQKPEISEAPSDPDADFRAHSFKQKLYEAIQNLKPKTREIFMLHKSEGLTYNEISEHLKIPKRTVEYNIYAALTQLKESLKDDYKKLKS